jgi:hypothetical protein
MDDRADRVVLPPKTLAESVRQDVMVDEPVSRGVTVYDTTFGGTRAMKEARELRSEEELRDEGDAAVLHDDELISTVSGVSIVRWNDRICNYVLKFILNGKTTRKKTDANEMP